MDTLTVKQLIQLLSEFKPDMPVYAIAAYNFYPVTYAHQIKSEVFLKTADIGGNLTNEDTIEDNSDNFIIPDEPIYPDIA